MKADPAELANLDCPVRVAVAMVLPKNDAPVGPDGVYGMLLLRRGSPGNEATCRAFFNAFDAVTEHALTDDRSDGSPAAVRTPTYWPIIAPLGNVRTTCDALLGSYDYGRALGYVARLGVRERPGPFLVALRADTEGGKPPEFARLDLSRFPDEELGRAMRVWSDLVTTPRSSRDGWVQMREDIRNALLTYGDAFAAFLLTPKIAKQYGIDPARAKGIPATETQVTFVR